jgi:hypothetical protein
MARLPAFGFGPAMQTTTPEEGIAEG